MSNGKVLYLPTQAHLSELKDAKREVSSVLLAPDRVSAFRAARVATSSDPDNNVVGVGIGEKITQRRHTGVLAVKILVRHKYSENQVPREHMLPAQWKGLPVDVVQTGTFRSAEALADPVPHLPNPRVRMRPIQPGSSVGFDSPSQDTGTFGLLVKKDGRTFMLSNSHVLADAGLLPQGAEIFQPGLLDGGNSATDRVATLADFIDFVPGQLNRVDAAIAEIDPGVPVSREILFLGAPRRRPVAALRDMIVHKFGRTTGYTVGRVISVDTDVSVSYDSGTFMFEDQILIDGLNNEPFSSAGDSGAAILERETNRPVGLLFAGSATHTLANHMGQVLGAFGVSVV
jgi:hypothetical protein